MFVKNRVDVILPVYNSENFVIKTINSIVNQSYNNFNSALSKEVLLFLVPFW